MTLHPSLHRLRQTFRDYAQSQAPDVFAFCGEALLEDHEEVALTANASPVIERLPDLASNTAPATQTIFHAVVDAAPHVQWRQSYTANDPGIDAEHLANYGWFNLIAPSGPFKSADLRLSVGYWEKGLSYPNHWHEPEEIYLTVAGSALYISQGRHAVRGGAGTTICHFANQPHAAEFDEMPLLAAAFWRGDNLEAKSTLEPER